MASATGTLEALANTIGTGLVQLQDLLNPGNAVGYFRQLGTNFPAAIQTDPDVSSALNAGSNAAGAFAQSLADLATAQQNGNSAGIIIAGAAIIGEIVALLSSLDSVASTIDGKAAQWAPLAATDVHDFTSNFTERVLADGILRELEDQRPEFVSAAVLLGVVERTAVPIVGGAPADLPAIMRTFRLDRLGDALSNPANYLQQPPIGWGVAPFDPTNFLQRFADFLSVFSSNIVIDTSSGAPVLEGVVFTVAGNSTTSPPGLDVTVNLPTPNALATSVALRPGFNFNLVTTGSLPGGTKLTVTPPSSISVTSPVTASIQGQLARTPIAPETAVVFLGLTGATRLQADSISLGAGVTLKADPTNTTASGDVSVTLSAVNGKLVVDFSQSDGFLQSITSNLKTEASFQFAATWSVSGGLQFTGSAGLTVRLPVHISLGPVEFRAIYIGLTPQSGSFPLELSTEIFASLGPFQVDVDRIGIEGTLKFPAPPARGNLGPADLAITIKPPTGIAVTVDAGAVSGGGFLSFDSVSGRYAGAIELSVYSVAVKAFGLVDTKLPDGTNGFSFVIVISAEFTPIQLGFGFTLIGVGGLLGINRSLNVEGLSNAVRAGSLDHVLFPRNPVQDAPAIINDLATIFPGAKGHYLFGPMAKLGWGTPTLISAELGIILELPGPRLSVLGIVQMALPTKATALLSINVALQGTLDFPGSRFAFDSSMYDSHVAGFNLSGDMSLRLSWGSNANFALSIGGFNPVFQPPPSFPTLKRITIDVGVDGNPSLTVQGYFAVTSNTAQTGASINLHASGFGIDLDGNLGFDAIFIFSPFSFQADFSAGVHVSFEGAGLGVTLHGTIKGPSPFHVDAQVCVSVLFFDACLPVSVTFGSNKPADLPPIDPLSGNPNPAVIGLQTAVSSAANWSGSFPTGTHSVVTLSAAAAAETQVPIDPVGQASLHQKVLPLNVQLSRFGAYKPTGHTRFSFAGVQIDDPDHPTANPSPTMVPPVFQDQFAPALFKDMSGAEQLSAQPYQPFDAGFTINPDTVLIGDIPSHQVTYDTEVVDNQNNSTVTKNDFPLTLRHLLGMLTRSASALSGIRRTGSERFVEPTAPLLVALAPETFVVVDACSLVKNTAVSPAPLLANSAAQAALDAHLAATPSDRGVYQVVPLYAAA